MIALQVWTKCKNSDIIKVNQMEWKLLAANGTTAHRALSVIDENDNFIINM